jgi:dephospho-CoA kinase
MLILGLTGDIACGKSTVARMLAERGAAILDSDLLVRELYARSEFAARVQGLFSSPVLTVSGEVDRGLLGQVVFDNPEALSKLESLVHPAVAALRHEKISALGGAPVVVNEAVKLLESGQGRLCDEIWCVVCAPEVQLRRLIETRGLSREQAELRLASQPSRERKRDLAGDVPLIWIENNSTLEELAQRIGFEWDRLRQT